MTTTPTEEAPAEPSVPEEGPRQTTPFLVLQFFIFPMAIVAACVAVFVVFGLISSDAKTARDHLADVRRGGGMFGVKRWQAAFAFAGALEADKGRAAAQRDPELVEEMVALFEESKDDDPRVRRYLALALGRMRDPGAVPALLAVARDPAADQDPETLIYSILALGAIGDPSAVPELVRLSAHADAGLRKAACPCAGLVRHAGGASRAHARDRGSGRRRALERGARAGPAARPGGPPGAGKMLDRATPGFGAGAVPRPGERRGDAGRGRRRGAARAGAAPPAGATARSDPDLKVREAARIALAAR